MFGWFRRRREYHDRVNAKASRLIEALGNDAWPTIYRESRDLQLPDEERLFYLAVRREVEKRVGIEPRADVATRYTDHLSAVLLLAAVFSLGPAALADEARIIGEARAIDGIHWTSALCASGCTGSMCRRPGSAAARRLVDRGVAVIVRRLVLLNF